MLLQPTGSSRILYSTGYRDKTYHSHARYRNEARLISRVEQNCRSSDAYMISSSQQFSHKTQFSTSKFPTLIIHSILVSNMCCTVVHLNLLIIRHLCISSKSGLLYFRASPSFRFREGRDRIILISGGK